MKQSVAMWNLIQNVLFNATFYEIFINVSAIGLKYLQECDQ